MTWFWYATHLWRWCIHPSSLVSLCQIVQEIWSRRKFWSTCGQVWKVGHGDLVLVRDTPLGNDIHPSSLMSLCQIVQEIWSGREFWSKCGQAWKVGHRWPGFGTRHTFGRWRIHPSSLMSLCQIVQEICTGREFWSKCGQAWKVGHSDLVLVCDTPLGDDASTHQVWCPYVK